MRSSAISWLKPAARLLAPFIALPALCLPAHAQSADYDPFEKTNRKMFAVHESIDTTVLEPSARGYRHITPTPVRTGVSNFLRNLRSPQIFVNDMLQGRLKRAGTTVARFGINSTIGIAGVLDPATRMGLERHTEDFGQTLGVWGVPAGPYLYVPVFGPTNVRDGAGAVVNLFLDPINYVRFDGDKAFFVFRTGMSALATRESVLDAIDNVRHTSIDPYVTIRSTYGLLRESSIRNGLRDVEDLPDFQAIPNYDEAPPAGEAPVAPPAEPPAASAADLPSELPPLGEPQTRDDQ